LSFTASAKLFAPPSPGVARSRWNPTNHTAACDWLLAIAADPAMSPLPVMKYGAPGSAARHAEILNRISGARVLRHGERGRQKYTRS
jgi:hypothetical protein